MEQEQWTSPTTLTPVSQHSMLGREPLLAALGAPPSPTAEDPLRLEGMDSAIPGPMATSTQASPQVAMSGNIPSVVPVSHSPSPPTVLKTPEVAGISSIPQTQVPPVVSPANLTEEVH